MVFLTRHEESIKARLWFVFQDTWYTFFHIHLINPLQALYLSLKTFAYLSTSSCVFPSISEAIPFISFRPYFSQALMKVLKSLRLHEENPYINQIIKIKKGPCESLVCKKRGKMFTSSSKRSFSSNSSAVNGSPTSKHSFHHN